MEPLRIPDLVVQKYQSIQSEALKKMQKMLKEETKITAAYKALQGPTTATTTNGTSAPAPDRTHGSPDWGGEDGPLNFRKALAVTPIAVSEFEANNTFPTFMGCSFIPTVFFSYFSKDKVQDPYHYTKWFKQTPGWKLLQLWHGNLNFRWLGPPPMDSGY